VKICHHCDLNEGNIVIKTYPRKGTTEGTEFIICPDCFQVFTAKMRETAQFIRDHDYVDLPDGWRSRLAMTLMHIVDWLMKPRE
jgi:hypothetical protein